MTDTTVTVPAGSARTTLAVESADTWFANTIGVVVPGLGERTLPGAPGAALDLGALPPGTTLGFFVDPDGDAAARRSGPGHVAATSRDAPGRARVAVEDWTDGDFGVPEGEEAGSLPTKEVPDWDALAAQVAGNHAATGQWFA